MSKDPYRYFRIEAREIVDALQRGVVELGAAADPEKLRTLLRASHTLKGAAGVVRHAEIARLAHEVEERLAARAPADAVLPLVDAIARELATLGAPAAPKVAAPKSAAPPPLAAESVRLDLEEVDALLASLADLSARIAAARAKTGPEREALLDGVDRLARDTIEDAQRLRLLRADTVFAEVARAAHDAAAREDRAVELETTGGDRRLDAHVLAVVRDALLQLVRNAIAHGIEPAAERTRAGKPAKGRIAIGVDLRGSRAVITCRDDGRGIDEAALRAAIVAKQLAPDEAGSHSADKGAATLTPDEAGGPTADKGAPPLTPDEAAKLDATGLFRLAMRGGVSTRAAASELAGRGVGLGVIAAALDRVRGSFTVQSRPGAGTEIALEVPVTLTAAPALMVEAADRVVTVRLDAIRRTVRFTPSDVVRTADGDVLSDGDGDRGERWRYGALARVLGVDAVSAARTALLLEVGGARAAVGVERVLGIVNEVVHPLPPAATAAPIVAGASLDGEGNPRLALDPRLLVDAIAALGAAAEQAAPEKRAPARVLVCDDSLTSRMLEQSILEAAGYVVTTAASGEEALEKARAGGFALFVVDVEMPGMSGFETVARMRADPAIANTPAVLVTSRSAPEDRRRGLEAGARAYIVKGDFAQVEFLETVRRLIG
ncbi:MAG: response regulator [Labilithrix sp.]|nr:response regulator [Labilithrix sp.]MCW5815427.1 response regulator [Labilithrix sp.]